MRLFLVRHAIAEDRAEFQKTGLDDSLRPLTVAGERRMHQVAQGLQKVVSKIDWIASSPYVRASHTAQILCEVLSVSKLESWKELTPDSTPDALVRRLARKSDQETGLLVSHEPLLSRFVGFLLAGTDGPQGSLPIIEFKKGAVASLDLTFEPRKSPLIPRSYLKWAMQPKHLREFLVGEKR